MCILIDTEMKRTVFQGHEPNKLMEDPRHFSSWDSLKQERQLENVTKIPFALESPGGLSLILNPNFQVQVASWKERSTYTQSSRSSRRSEASPFYD